MLDYSLITNLSQVFCVDNVKIYLIISLLNAILMSLISYRFLQIMQQSNYEGIGYFKWIRRRDNAYLTRLAILTMLSLLVFLLVGIFFSFIKNDFVLFIGFGFYVVFCSYYYLSEKKKRRKVPVVFTARMVRLFATYVIVVILFSFGLICLVSFLAFLVKNNVLVTKMRFAPLCLTPITLPILVLVAYYITKPYENYVHAKFIKKCVKTLESRKNLIKIAITGSYGKTSTKEILKTILQEKYNVLATPMSYNTPMGICKSIKRLKPEHQVFIAEMGARRVGDIKQLAEMVKPDYAVFNGIVGQHLETFGSLNAIKNTKYELVESMTSGMVAYTVDNLNTRQLLDNCKLDTITTGINLQYNPQVYATDVKLTTMGSSFYLCYNQEKTLCTTSLIGEHNISNICLASAIALKLGLSLQEISSGIARLTPISHRLEPLENNKGLVIIDDSYNSNTQGVKVALDVLKLYQGRKIIITPGMVELGREQDYENYKMGIKIAKVFDIAILVGRSSTYKIQDGLIDGGFDCDNMFIVKDLDSAKKKLNKIAVKGDIVLFENDLPDKYTM